MTSDPSNPAMFRIDRLTTGASDADVQGLAELLIDAVQSGAAVSFMTTLTRPMAEQWWRKTIAGADRAIILVARDAHGIAGSVQLHPAWAPNQPDRADLAKLLVHRRRRKCGLGTKLMLAAEDAARAAQIRLLTLDAKRGGDAERMYRRLGWTYVGMIPRFALDPDGKAWHDDVLFYKEVGGVAGMGATAPKA